MPVQLNNPFFGRELFLTNGALFNFTGNKFFNSKNMLGQLPCFFELLIGSQINIFIAESKNGRGFYTYQRCFIGNN
jgi:hypothetical protein